MNTKQCKEKIAELEETIRELHRHIAKLTDAIVRMTILKESK